MGFAIDFPHFLHFDVCIKFGCWRNDTVCLIHSSLLKIFPDIKSPPSAKHHLEIIHCIHDNVLDFLNRHSDCSDEQLIPTVALWRPVKIEVELISL